MLGVVRESKDRDRPVVGGCTHIERGKDLAASRELERVMHEQRRDGKRARLHTLADDEWLVHTLFQLACVRPAHRERNAHGHSSSRRKQREGLPEACVLHSSFRCARKGSVPPRGSPREEDVRPLTRRIHQHVWRGTLERMWGEPVADTNAEDSRAARGDHVDVRVADDNSFSRVDAGFAEQSLDAEWVWFLGVKAVAAIDLEEKLREAERL